MAAQALFTVIDGTLINLAKVNSIERSKLDASQVIIHFENTRTLVLNGSIETVLMKIGGSREDMGQDANGNRRA